VLGEIQKMVAIKKMKIDEKVGFEQTTIRELKILGEIRHPNIIGLRDVFV
jgi:serine/threonine protein kinase